MAGMIERVGRALAKEERYAYDPVPYDARARAAIQAMREPTEAMIEVADWMDGAAKTHWYYMIDAALKDT